MTNIDSILKSRDITDKGLSSQSYGFSSSHVWLWELDHNEGWAPKNWCFWTVMLLNSQEKTLRVPWTARRSNQPILKEISPEYSLEGLMLKLKLQYFGHLMQRTDSLEKTLILGKIRRRQWQPTPVLLSRKSHGRRSVVGYSRKESGLSNFTFTFFQRCTSSCDSYLSLILKMS